MVLKNGKSSCNKVKDNIRVIRVSKIVFFNKNENRFL